MSVTFGFQGDELMSEEMDCRDCKHYGASETCHICKGTGRETERWFCHELNLSNSNAFMLLRAIGVSEPDYVGCITTAELREKAKAFYDRSWRRGETPPGPETLYLEEKCIRLIQLADAATIAGVGEITWG